MDASGTVTIDTEALPAGGGTTPAVPTGLVAVAASSSEINLTWDVTTGASAYDVQRSTDNVTFSTITSASTNSYTDSGRAPATQYWYKIRAENSIGNSAYTAAVTASTLASGGGSGTWRGLTDTTCQCRGSNGSCISGVTDRVLGTYLVPVLRSRGPAGIRVAVSRG